MTYRGRTFALGTQHGKGPLFATAFNDHLGAVVREIACDTDAFGTFAGERPRERPAVETAIAKARRALDVSGLTLGLASEGTFGPDPALPFLASDIEHVVAVDLELDLVVVEHARRLAPVHHRCVVDPGADVAAFLQRADFPAHALIVRPEDGDPASVVKGIVEPAALASAIARAAERSPTGRAIVENDLRAHCSPTRRAVIEEAAGRLARRLATRCPACDAPGWGLVDVERGLPCADCETPTTAVLAEVRGCASCPERARTVMGGSASPATCPACNP